MHSKSNQLLVVCLSLVFLSAAGCGGAGGTSPVNPGGGVTTTSLGNSQVSYIGKAVPFQAAGDGSAVTVNGMAGASFTSVKLMPTPNIQNTAITYASTLNNAVDEIYSIANGVSTQVTATIYGALAPSYSNDARIVFSTYTQSGFYELATCNADGTGYTQLTTSNWNHNNPSWSPDGQHIAYDDGTNIWLTKTNPASPETEMFAGTLPSWSPDSLYLLYANKAIESSSMQVYYHSATSTTGSPLNISSQYSTVNCTQPSMSADKKWIAYTVTVGGVTRVAVEDASSLPASAASTVEGNLLPTPANNSDSEPTFSPDGRSLIFGRSNGPSPTLYVTDPTGQVETSLGAAGTGQYHPSWQPYQAQRNFIGSAAIGVQTGPQFSSAAGFLWAQNGSQFGSFVSFTATTPADATITPVSSGGSGAAFVEHLHADAITGIKYSNNYYEVAAGIVTSNVSDTLISFDGNLGTVTTVAPYVLHGSLPPAAAIKSGGTLVYRGSFAGVYDAAGVNHAPSGATEIDLDAKTGKLISAH